MHPSVSAGKNRGTHSQTTNCVRCTLQSTPYRLARKDQAILNWLMIGHSHLHPLLPDRNEHGYELRRRLPDAMNAFSNGDKRNFVYRQLQYTKTATNFSLTVLISIFQLRFDNS